MNVIHFIVVCATYVRTQRTRVAELLYMSAPASIQRLHAVSNGHSSETTLLVHEDSVTYSSLAYSNNRTVRVNVTVRCRHYAVCGRLARVYELLRFGRPTMCTTYVLL